MVWKSTIKMSELDALVPSQRRIVIKGKPLLMKNQFSRTFMCPILRKSKYTMTTSSPIHQRCDTIFGAMAKWRRNGSCTIPKKELGRMPKFLLPCPPSSSEIQFQSCGGGPPSMEEGWGGAGVIFVVINAFSPSSSQEKTLGGRRRRWGKDERRMLQFSGETCPSRFRQLAEQQGPPRMLLSPHLDKRANFSFVR